MLSIFSDIANRLKVVDEKSSILGVDGELVIPIEASHSGICKFPCINHPICTPVLGQLEACSVDALESVRERIKCEAKQGPKLHF